MAQTKLQARVNQRLMAQVVTEFPAAKAKGPWPTQVLLFTQAGRGEVLEQLREDARRMIAGEAPGHQLFVLEHPPTLEAADETAFAAHGPALLEELGVKTRVVVDGKSDFDHDFDLEVRKSGASKGGDQKKLGAAARYIGPGMLALYYTVHTGHSRARTGEMLGAMLADAAMQTLGAFEVEAKLKGGRIVAGGRTIAEVSVETEPGSPVARGEVFIHTNTDPRMLARFAANGSLPVTMTELGMPIGRQDEVREKLLANIEKAFATEFLIPQKHDRDRTTKPPWLRAKLPYGKATMPIHRIMAEQKLHTVCESAHCPNMGECWAQGTATFMINGNVCTRSCSFCAIFTGRPEEIDPDEPKRVAEAAAQMGLTYVVVTAVNRDERRDGGAGQFAATIRELRKAIPGVRVEVLIPDFKGDTEALEEVFAERPEVLNHNMETVKRLYYRVRPQADYERSLEVLARAGEAGLVVKSGFMLGLGEEKEEVEQLLRDQRAHGCNISTIGQYLRPSMKHHPVIRYVTPAEFDNWRIFGEGLGMQRVESGPMVRSSYHAHDALDRALKNT